MSEIKEEKREATSIKIKPNLWREAKIEAIRQNKTVSELVEEALEAVIKTRSLSEQKARQIANKYAKPKE